MKKAMKPPKIMLVPCDADAPRSCTEETDDHKWYQRAWKPGEKEEYRSTVLMKPAPVAQYR